MQENGDIFIFVEEEKKITISANDRTLNARKVYEALMYEPDDTFQVQKKNDANKDEKIFNALVKLFEDIARSLNELKEAE